MGGEGDSLRQHAEGGGRVGAQARERLAPEPSASTIRSSPRAHVARHRDRVRAGHAQDRGGAGGPRREHAIEDTAADEARGAGGRGAGRRSRATGRFERADVVVEDGRIAAIEPDAAVGDAQVIDAAGALVLPGFVDTHRHTWQTAMRGICADWTLLDYFRGIRLQISTAFGPEDVYAGNFVGRARGARLRRHDAARLLPLPELSRPRRRGRARAARGRACAASGRTGCSRCRSRSRCSPRRRTGWPTRAACASATSPPPGDTLDMGVALTELGLVPFDVTRAEVALARELDVMVTAHIGSVTSAQRPPEVELLHAAGLLDHRQVHVHCNACSNRELDLLADAGASVSLTPETELQMGMGFPIFARALERGLDAEPRLRHRLQQPRRPVRADAPRAAGGARAGEPGGARRPRDAAGADARRARRAAVRDARRGGGARPRTRCAARSSRARRRT